MALRAVIALVMLTAANAQLTPCGIYDPATNQPSGAFAITIEMTEADTQPALVASANTDAHRKLMPIYGNLNSQDPKINISLTMYEPTSSWGLEALNPNDYFVLEADAANNLETYIRMTAPIDRDGATASLQDDIDVIELVVQCRNWDDPSGPYRTMSVFIAINDLNDNAPVFANTPYTANVDELTPVASPALTIYSQILAEDKDSVGEHSQITYSLVDDFGKFAIPLPGQGSVTLIGALDYESMATPHQYRLEVVAADQGTPPQSTTTTLTVVVKDGNDLPPTFEYYGCNRRGSYCLNPHYLANTVGAVGPLTLTPEPISARDVDTLNAEIVYSIPAGSPATYSQYFSIAPDTGIISLTQAIQRNQIAEFDLTVEARENSIEQRFTTASVFVVVAPANNVPPTVLTNSGSFVAFIAENSPQDTLASTNTDLNRPFQITPTDADVLATDPDPTFTFTADGNDFSIDANGFVFLRPGINLDYETTQEYKFLATVTEVGTVNPKSNSATVTVSVVNRNDIVPKFDLDYYESNVAAGSTRRLVSTVKATDTDFTPVVYSIDSVTPASGASLFSITTRNDNTGAPVGDVFINGQVNIDQAYSVKINARDSAQPASEQLTGSTFLGVTIVPDGIRGPMFAANQYNVDISESLSVTARIITIPATDADGDSLTYGISSSPDANVFAIDNQGVVTLNQQVDRETREQLTAVITASYGTQTASTNLQVTINDYNDVTPALNQQQYFGSITENANSGTNVLTVQANDGDATAPNSDVTYSVSGTTDFTINPTSGQITNTRPLDFETETEYNFFVTATDGGNPALAQSRPVRVTVIDVDDNAPFFPQDSYTVSLPEGVVPQQPVLQLDATDLDAQPQISYIIVTGNNENKFTLGSTDGNLRQVQAMSHERTQQYLLVVSTQQAEANPPQGFSTATVTVNVLHFQDRNDEPPVFDANAPYTATIREDNAPGTIILTVAATDADSIGLRYAVTSAQPTIGSTLYYLEPVTGVLHIRVDPVTDTSVDQYTLNIQVSYNGNHELTAATTATINVIRNKFAPNFFPSSKTVEIDANHAAGTKVTDFAATDSDTDNAYSTLTYAVLPFGVAPTYFNVVGSTGEVQLRSSVAQETAYQYQVVIETKDGGGRTGTGTVIVNVNRNLNAPAYTTTQSTITINENQALYQQITRLAATDSDSLDPNNVVTYTITGQGNARNHFGIDQTGSVFVTQNLMNDKTQPASYTVTFGCNDNGTPQQNCANSHTLTININRNNAAPVFNSTEYRVTIPATNGPGSPVQQLTASDADTENDFNQLTFEIIGDDTAPNFFQLQNSGNPNQPDVVLSQSLAAESATEYQVRVIAKDNGTPGLTATAVVYVTVTENFPTHTSGTFRLVPYQNILVFILSLVMKTVN